MGFSSLKELVDAETAGKWLYRSWRKLVNQTNPAYCWFDFSMTPGNPVPQYYAAAPLAAVAMRRSTDGGLDHGPNVAPASKYLRRMMIMAPGAGVSIPMTAIVCDYLMFYPFIDEGSTDVQTLTNTVTLPRYTDGAGVQIMAVSVASRTGGQTFNVTYTNSDGVAGRTTQTLVQLAAAVTGSILTTTQHTNQSENARGGPFIPLQTGDTGVRSIDAVQMVSGTDVGLFTLVLVKPLAQLTLRGVDAPVEVDYLTDFGQVPQIVDDAYLNIVGCPANSLSAVALLGSIETVWS